MVEIGYPLRAEDPLDFCFDNETPRHSVFLEPFQIATRKVTCREYLEFISDDAYARPELWLSEGWDNAKRAAWQAPLYWRSVLAIDRLARVHADGLARAFDPT